VAACAVLLWGIGPAMPAFAQDTAAPAAPDAAETIPFRDDELLARGLLLRVLAVTLLGVGAALAAAWALRRFLHRRLPAGLEQASISLIGFKKLTPRLGVYVIEVDRTRFALVESGDSLVQIPLPGTERDGERA